MIGRAALLYGVATPILPVPAIRRDALCASAMREETTAGNSNADAGARRPRILELPVRASPQYRRRIEVSAICAAPSRRAGVSSRLLRVLARPRPKIQTDLVTEAVPMNPNPFADVVAFVTNRLDDGRLWLLVLASVVISGDRVEPLPSSATSRMSYQWAIRLVMALLVAAEFVETAAVLTPISRIAFGETGLGLLDGLMGNPRRSRCRRIS